MSLTVLHEAEVELWEAVDYFESRHTGLGLDFLHEIETSLETIRNAPTRWRLREDGTRRYLTPRFPYFIVYLLEEGHIWIVAFAHCKRRPQYWEERKTIAEQESGADADKPRSTD